VIIVILDWLICQRLAGRGIISVCVLSFAIQDGETLMRVRVDPELCQGHGMCHMSAPEIFQLREDDGHSYVLFEEVPPELEDAARLGAESCPECAITVSQTES
jgi:ferredoxin